VYALCGNWGVAIIVVTFLLKLLFYPLSEASGRSMAKMKTLSPRIKNLQETYKDDKEKLGRAMMELYKREKINPVAGCLPIIIQIPVFLAFYWVLLESVEMRQAPFAGWINDLSSRDPLFILPLIMAGAMLVQYKLNPTPPDPIQAKVFMIMPLVMSFTFAFFPAGLVLYWVTNTLLSIAQQWNINRRIGAAAAKKDHVGARLLLPWTPPTPSSRRRRPPGAAGLGSCACRGRRSLRSPSLSSAGCRARAWRLSCVFSMAGRSRLMRASRCTFRLRIRIPASTYSSCRGTAVRSYRKHSSPGSLSLARGARGPVSSRSARSSTTSSI
jgi:YidC/Oxa1 family membrane protein insertase